MGQMEWVRQRWRTAWTGDKGKMELKEMRDKHGGGMKEWTEGGRNMGDKIEKK